jgi:hypothetical protein
MKKIISSIAIVVLITACTKNNHKEVTVTGRLMQSCDTPAANKNGLIHLPGGGILSKPSTKLEFTTDENGYFKVTHDKSFSTFSVRTSANHSVLDVSSLGGDEKELGEVYVFPPTARYYLTLHVNNNNYNELDTLTYSNGGFPHDGRDPWLKKAGPFQSGVIDTVHLLSHTNDLPVSFNELNNTEITKKKIHYYLGEYDSWNERVSHYFSTAYCQEGYQTVTLVID